MTRSIFSQEMQEVKGDTLLLGSMVEEAVMKSVDALRDNNVERSRFVIANNEYINRKRFDIESDIIVLMATQQPNTRDLRTLAASLDICTELERMGDYAKGIANINIRSGGLSMPSILREIYSMGGKAMDMLHRAMTTYADEDMQTAKTIIQDDDIIDGCYTHLYYGAVKSVIENPRNNFERANYVIWTAHNLERLGDRTTNICERVIYIVTGERYEYIPVTPESKLSEYDS